MTDHMNELVVMALSKAKPSKHAASLKLSSPEMKPAVVALKKFAADDPDFHRALLRQAGIVTATGKLSKNFGG